MITGSQMETDSVGDHIGDPVHFSQHKLLLDVDSELDSGDIENMKFLCHDVIPLSKLQKIDRGIDLFVQLENANKISPKRGNMEMLVEILFRVRRLDLVKKLGRISKEVRRKYGGSDRATTTNLLPFRNLLYELLEELTDEDYVQTKFVLQSQFGKGTMAKLKSMMEFFTFLEREQELEIDDVSILYKIMDIVKRSDLKEKIKEYEKYPYKKGRPGPPLLPVAGLGVGPTKTPMVVDTIPVRASRPSSGGVQVSDIEMVDTTQNFLPAGNGILDSHLTSISVELAKEPKWRMLCTELGMSIDELNELTATSDTASGKIYLMLSYWKESIVHNSPDAGRLLYMAMYQANLQLMALKLAMNNLFPGVVMEPIPNSPADNTETRMEEQVNPQTQPIPTSTPGTDLNNENQPPVAHIPPRPQDPQPNQGTNAIMPENNVIHREEAQVSIVGPPNPSPANQQMGVQRSSNTDDGRMSGAAQLPRPAVNETQQQRQDNELIRQIQRANIDNELDLPSYKMDAKPRGVCVIINNEKFHKIPGDEGSKEMPDRIGTHKDAERLTTVFRKLDFRVETYDNCTDIQMAQLLSGVGYRNHSEFDCFVCCILTHGASGHIFGSNGKMVRIEILTGFFRAQVCPTLAGKPKLFFIQACQGREKQRGLDIEADTAPVPMYQPERQDLMVDISGREMIPDEADFILGYATVPGYVSYRSRSQGSWFINKLVDMLDKYAYRYDLLSVLVKVNEEVGHAIANVDGGQYKQIPAPLVTLRKKLYFR